jgi:hypothetical protein
MNREQLRQDLEERLATSVSITYARRRWWCEANGFSQAGQGSTPAAAVRAFLLNNGLDCPEDH